MACSSAAEHLTLNQGCVGSSPTGPTNTTKLEEKLVTTVLCLLAIAAIAALAIYDAENPQAYADRVYESRQRGKRAWDREAEQLEAERKARLRAE